MARPSQSGRSGSGATVFYNAAYYDDIYRVPRKLRRETRQLRQQHRGRTTSPRLNAAARAKGSDYYSRDNDFYDYYNYADVPAAALSRSTYYHFGDSVPRQPKPSTSRVAPAPAAASTRGPAAANRRPRRRRTTMRAQHQRYYSTQATGPEPGGDFFDYYGRQTGYDSSVPINAAYYPQGRPFGGGAPATGVGYAPSTVITTRRSAVQYGASGRRSRTAPARLIRPAYYQYQERTGAPSVVSYRTTGGADRLRSYSGPTKYPTPLYFKRSYYQHRGPTMAYAAGGRRRTYPLYGGAPTNYAPSAMPSQVQFGPPPAESFYGTMRRTEGPFAAGAPAPMMGRPAWGYTPSMVGADAYRSRKEMADSKYPPAARFLMKVVQVILGVIVWVFVSLPTIGYGLGQFISSNDAQGQILVLALASVALFISFCLLLTLQAGRRHNTWRNADAAWSAILLLFYVIASGVEIWYAACYPPVGLQHPLACRLWQWAIAAAACILAAILYAVDMVLAFRTGVSVF